MYREDYVRRLFLLIIDMLQMKKMNAKMMLGLAQLQQCSQKITLMWYENYILLFLDLSL